jgi:hypothetical protein
MSSTQLPWFYPVGLRAQLSQDIIDALQAGRINEQQSVWLQPLVSELHYETVRPRVDRLSRGDGGLLNAKLAGALLITDADNITSDIYLWTSLEGVERFDSRQQLVARLSSWFGQHSGDPGQLGYEEIDGDVFESSMLSIVDQQVQQLQRLNEHLQDLPSLHTAVGETLQEQIDAQLSTEVIDVFNHFSLIKEVDSTTKKGVTLRSETLVDAALRSFADKPLPTGLRQQWLDSQGQELSDDQAKSYQQALEGVGSEVGSVYENLLTDYWSTLAVGEMTRRDLLCDVFAERFRQHLLECRHQSRLNAAEYAALKSLCPCVVGGADQVRVSKLSVSIGDQDPLKLVGIFLIAFTSQELPDLFLYSAKQGLQRFADRAALAEHFAGIDGLTLMFGHTSINDHPLLRTKGAFHLRLDLVQTTPLTSVVDSVIALQKRDLANVLERLFTSGLETAFAVVNALDIRALIDPRLMDASGVYRWNEAMQRSDQQWSDFNSPLRIAELDIHISETVDERSTLPWAMWLRDARMRVDSIFAARPTVLDCAQKLLSRYFSVLHSGTVDAQHVRLQPEHGDAISLTALLIERITGFRDAEVLHDCHVYVDSADSTHPQALPWLTPDLLDHVLSRSQQAFVQEYPDLVRGFRNTQLQVSNAGVIPANASRSIREGLLRLGLAMQRNSGEVSDHGLGMLEQAVNRPVFNLRKNFGIQATQVHVPTLEYDSTQPAVPLTNIIVLQQPSNSECKPLMWSAVLGLVEFESLAELQLNLVTRLVFAGSRDRWLDLISDPDRGLIQRILKQSDTHRLAIGFNRLDEDFIEHLEQAELSRQSREVEVICNTAVGWRADAALFERMLSATELDDRLRTIIDTLSGQVEMTLLSGRLPDWLKKASIQDLSTFRQLLVRFGQLFNGRGAIHTLLSLTGYAAEQLQQRLLKDFPTAQLDPDRITVTLTRYTVAPGGVGDVPSSIPGATNVISESLTRYAINRFYRFQDAALSVSSDEATALPASLDALYIQELVRTLDVAVGYEQYLKQQFSETAANYAERLDQFIVQAPYAMLLMAYVLKMQGVLSGTGYGLVENVVSMPDGLARLPMGERAVIFSPLKLVAAQGYAPDVAAGMFLIGPANQAEGPWILHAVADADYLFKEYASQAEFLNELYTSPKLQSLVLKRLDPAVRFVYERDGFIQPHLSWATGGFTDLSGPRPGPVQLSVEPLQENALQSLFRASKEVMLIIAKDNSVTTAESDIAASRFLLLLGVEQTLTFLPGRVGGLVGLWQTQDLLDASLDSASQHNWAKATFEFTAALAVLISELQHSEDITAAYENRSAVPEEAAHPRWHDPQLQVDLDGRLQQYEVRDVSLSNLQRDDNLNVYKNPVTLKQYAAVFGKVYRVKSGPDGWSVIDGAKEGPRIRLNDQKHWVLDSDMGSRRDGGALTRLRAAQTDFDVNDLLLVNARGMPEIQRLYPRKAKQLVEAHDRARYYLENAQSNLTVMSRDRKLDPQAERIINDFFGTKSPDEVSVISIKQTFDQLYRLLLDPAFSPRSSQRYVLGTNKLGYEESTAFNFEKDPLHRIFFTERYFTAPYVRLKRIHYRQGGFNTGTHFRAAVLIHELSHIASGSHDIAYVDSNVPFLDLLEDAGTYRARLKLEHKKAQSSLSHLTPRDELFRMDDGTVWRDLKTADGDAKKAVLKIAGTSSLDAARDKFLSNPLIRSKVILSNADSVALLVTLLGRERF